MSSLIFGAASVHAATLGQQYLSIDSGHRELERADADQLGLTYNTPLIQQERFGLDWSVHGLFENRETYYGADRNGQHYLIYGADVAHWTLGAGLTAYVPLNSRVSAFVFAQAAGTYAQGHELTPWFWNGPFYGDLVKDHNYTYFGYGVELGLEISVTEALSTQVALGANNDDDRDDPACYGSISANYWLTDVLGVNLGFRYIEYKHDSEDAQLYTLSLPFRF